MTRKSLRAWTRLTDPLELLHAWRGYARGKRRRPNVAAFALDAESEVLRIARELALGTWRPGPFTLKPIADPKRRIVAAAPVGDRVLYQALHRILAPELDRGLSAQTYASLPGRGSHRAVLRFRQQLGRKRHVLALDIRHFFYSIDRERLYGLLAPRLREEPVRRVVRRILDSGRGLYADPHQVEWLGWDAPLEPGRGLPIGNLTSQWWGNHYLAGLDHFVQRELRLPAYQRYMDDFHVFHDDARRLVRAREEIAAWLASERGLELKEPQARPRRTDRRQLYLGYQVSRGGILPGPRMRMRARLHAAAAADSLPRLRASLASVRASWTFG